MLANLLLKISTLIISQPLLSSLIKCWRTLLQKLDKILALILSAQWYQYWYSYFSNNIANINIVAISIFYTHISNIRQFATRRFNTSCHNVSYLKILLATRQRLVSCYITYTQSHEVNANCLKDFFLFLINSLLLPLQINCHQAHLFIGFKFHHLIGFVPISRHCNALFLYV